MCHDAAQTVAFPSEPSRGAPAPASPSPSRASRGGGHASDPEPSVPGRTSSPTRLPHLQTAEGWHPVTAGAKLPTRRISRQPQAQSVTPASGMPRSPSFREQTPLNTVKAVQYAVICTHAGGGEGRRAGNQSTSEPGALSARSHPASRVPGHAPSSLPCRRPGGAVPSDWKVHSGITANRHLGRLALGSEAMSNYFNCPQLPGSSLQPHLRKS